MKASGSNVPLTLYPILLKLEGGCYGGPILPGDMMYILAGRSPGVSGGGGNGGVGGMVATIEKVSASGLGFGLG